MMRRYRVHNKGFLDRVLELKEKGILRIAFGVVIFLLIVVGALYSNLYTNRVGDYTPLRNIYCQPEIGLFKRLLDYRENQTETNQHQQEEAYPEEEEELVIPVDSCQVVLSMGTDGDGRDIMKNLLVGCNVVLLSGAIAVSIALLLGTAFGIFSGYLSDQSLFFFIRRIFKGREKVAEKRSYSIYFGDLVNLFPTFVNIFPRLILIAVILSVRKIDIWSVMIAIGIINVPKLSYIIKDKIEHLKNQEFIEAARELGVSHSKIILKHILWYNCRPIILVQAAFIFAEAILVESSLSYLEHGLNESWGYMVAREKDLITGSSGIYWPIFFPAAAIVITIIAFHALGDGLSRWLQIKR